MIRQSPLVQKLISLAIEEDLSSGDITSELTVSAESESQAELIAKQDGVLCGMPVVEMVFNTIDPQIEISTLVTDGQSIEAGQVLCTLRGSTRSLLAGERIALNFLQRLSGIASHAFSLVEQAGDLVLLDTRKTTPGWRVLEKYAVRIGGASNHRMSLGDMIMVKDNHIDAEGNLRSTLRRVLEGKPKYMSVEVEVRTLEELRTVLEYPIDIVMLDNMDDQEVAQALALVQEAEAPVQIEVSGMITSERFEKLRDLGVPAVSMGALTTKASSLDISMRMAQK